MKLLKVYIFIFLFFSKLIFAQDFSRYSNRLPNILYYDADDDIKINVKLGLIELNKNASFLLGNVFISADKIIILKNEGMISAEGKVRLIYNKEKATASRIIFDLKTNQLRLDNAQIFSDPYSTDEVVSKEVLGITKAELAFDSERAKRTLEIEHNLLLIRDEYANLKSIQINNKNDNDINDKIKSIISRYSQMLARYTRTRFQPNSYLAGLSDKDKERYLKRREAVKQFNIENPEISKSILNFQPISSYVSVAASQIIQKNDGTFILNNAIVTPCHCSSIGEPPLYGFSSNNAQIEMGQYLTLQGTTLDIFSVPLFYSPWFKVSIKNKRESGFLYPSGYASNNAGSVLTVPFFITLGDHADSTVTYNHYSDRGNAFELELRHQLNTDNNHAGTKSQFYSNTKYIKDKKYSTDYHINSERIDNYIRQNPQEKNNYEFFRGVDRTTRWSTEESFQLPIYDNYSLKGNGLFVSDSNFLSDFSSNSSITDPNKIVTGDTTSASMRFLPHELDAEYYGDNFVLSIRGQGQQDLFAYIGHSDSIRLPKIEYSLLPKRYLNSLFVIENNTSVENVVLPDGGLPYIYNNNLSSLDRIYLEGKRIYSTSTLSVPLPYNDYINASASVSIVGVQYYFPSTLEYSAEKPYQGYLKYDLKTDVPIYFRHDLYDQSGFTNGSIVETLSPFVSINYIPNVIRSSNFPNTYSLWYSQDSTSSSGMTPLGMNLPNNSLTTSAYLNFGVSSSLKIRKAHFVKSDVIIDRFSKEKSPPVADIDYLVELAKEKNIKVTETPMSIFEFSTESESSEVYKGWAEKELNGYYLAVQKNEMAQNFIWPTSSSTEIRTELDITPIKVSLYSNYNFLAQETANQQNKNAGSLLLPFPVTHYGDIIGELDWDLNPLLNIKGNYLFSYSPVYRRYNSSSYGINTTLPYHVNISYNYSYQYILPPNMLEFVKKSQNFAGIEYSPRKWATVGFQWSYSEDPTAIMVDTTSGRAYGSSYYVTLTGFQDCLDVILARNKAPGTPERQSTYVIGLNLKIFGFSTGYEDVGDYINRRLQN